MRIAKDQSVAGYPALVARAFVFVARVGSHDANLFGQINNESGILMRFSFVKRKDCN
jgi:hypothetical protein